MRGGEKGDRGAALVEYAVLVALIVVAGMASFDFFGAAARGRMERTDRAISRQLSPGDTVPVDTAPPPTPPPTTAPPATTTTTAPATKARASFGTTSSRVVSYFWWTGTADLSITRANGSAVSGAKVTVQITPAGGTPRTVEVTTGADGKVVIDVGTYERWGATSVEVEVISVEATGVTWDGTAAATTVRAP